MTDTPLDGCLAKLQRAQSNFNALQQEFQRFIWSHPYRMTGHADPESGEYLMQVKVIRDAPWTDWGVRVGEVLHLLRSSLDNLAFQLALRKQAPPPTATEFPIYVDRDRFFAKDRRGEWRRGSGVHKLTGLKEIDGATIESLQPYHRGDDAYRHPLAVLHDLDRFNKHRIVPVVAGLIQNMAGFQILEDVVAIDSFEAAFAWHTPIEDGVVIARFQITGPNPKVQMNMDIAYDVAFGKADPAHGIDIGSAAMRPVVLVINEIVEFVEREVFLNRFIPRFAP